MRYFLKMARFTNYPRISLCMSTSNQCSLSLKTSGSSILVKITFNIKLIYFKKIKCILYDIQTVYVSQSFFRRYATLRISTRHSMKKFFKSFISNQYCYNVTNPLWMFTYLEKRHSFIERPHGKNCKIFFYCWRWSMPLKISVSCKNRRRVQLPIPFTC